MARLSLQRRTVKGSLLTFLGLALAGSVTLFPGLGEAPVATEPLPARPADVPVRIEHELIRVPEVRQPARPVLAAPPVRRARTTASPQRAPLARARRVLFGDGTYRPEPFPRPTR
jgi:hypothetical protein